MHLAMTELKEREARIAQLEEAPNLTYLRTVIADDSYAMTFQTFGQYRTALMNAIDKILAARSVLNKESGGTKGARTPGELQHVGWLTQAGNIVTGLATYREADARLYGWEPVYRRIKKENDRA